MRLITKKSVLLLLAGLFTCSFNLSAQSWDEIVSDTSYYYGIGVGKTLENAQKAAMADLSGKISTAVASSFVMIEDETFKDGELDASSYVSSKVNTYSTATLTNSHHLEKMENGEWHSLRYLKHEEMNKVFEGRKSQVKELVRSAEKAEKAYKIGDALKYYYWAFSLLKTVQYPDKVIYVDEENIEHELATYIPVQMNNVLDDIRVEVINHDSDVAELSFSFRGHPIVNMEYTYFNGRSVSNIYSVKDGRGEVEFAGFEPEYLQLNVEYTYLQDAKLYRPEMATVLEVVQGHSLSKSIINIPLSSKKQKTKHQTQRPTNKVKSALVEISDDDVYREKAEGFITAISSKKYHSIDNYFTANGLSMYNQLLKYGTPRIHGKPNYKVYRSGSEVVVRSIPMSFSFQKGARKNIMEDVVLCFDADGQIDFLAFALDEPAVNDILYKGEWSDTVRQTILRFLEDYKTAYCLERIEYLDQLFSDDALIVVGHVLNVYERNDENDRISYRNNQVIKKTQYTKPQYMEHLKVCFNRNECINIHFAENNITKAGKGNETFGIQIKQDYYSTTYGDSGWLFLVVDFNDPSKPIITTRVWQEKVDPDFGLAGLKDFQ